MMDDLFIETEFHAVQKFGQSAAGDVFTIHKDREKGRLIAILSDGLGSGVKANILANMTVRMALTFALSETDVRHYAQVIMDALPVCQVRRIAYATFTVVDCRPNGVVDIVEQGNPPFVLLRNQQYRRVPCRTYTSRHGDYRNLRRYQFRPRPEDRIVFFSDGVTEAGLGTSVYKLGWRREGCVGNLLDEIGHDHNVSARMLAQRTVANAVAKEPERRAGDDITCGVIYFRRPRCTIVASGPPFRKEHDAAYARRIATFDGRKAICGGTSADIVSRELKREITTDLPIGRRSRLPPVSHMAGIDLVTEGILTLTETLGILEGNKHHSERNGATELAGLLRDSDRIVLLVGTTINAAHQDPSLPVELEIRRSLMKQLGALLRDRYLKEVEIQFT